VGTGRSDPRRARKLGRADLQGKSSGPRGAAKLESGRASRRDVRVSATPRLSRQQTGKSAEHRRFPNPQGRPPATENLKLGSRLKLFGCIHSGGGSNTPSLSCLVASQNRALDGGNGCVCVLEPMGPAAQNTAILRLGASKISLQIRTTEFTNPTRLAAPSLVGKGTQGACNRPAKGVDSDRQIQHSQKGGEA